VGYRDLDAAVSFSKEKGVGATKLGSSLERRLWCDRRNVLFRFDSNSVSLDAEADANACLSFNIRLFHGYGTSLNLGISQCACRMCNDPRALHGWRAGVVVVAG